MKKILCICVIFAVVIGCSLKHSPEHISTDSKLTLLTRSYFDHWRGNEFVLTEADVDNYVHFRNLEGKSKGRTIVLSEIIPLYWEDEVCLYVLQYEEGFDVISADKRSPIPLAEVSYGTFEECNDPNGFGGHLNLMAEEVWFSLNDYTNPSQDAEESIQSSLDFWRMVNADSTFIARNADSTYNGIGLRLDPNIPPGHWVLVGVDTVEEVYDSIPHLTTTTWYQRGIYNYYCPDDKDSLDVIVECPAGCVAIAGAQMLYYLHFKEGVPLNSPANGYCYGHVYDNSYVQFFWNHSSSTWAAMQPPRSATDTLAALLVGDVGKKLEISYTWNGSSASTVDLKNDVFPPYGWNSEYSDSYLSNKIVSNLQNGFPVVCAGQRETRGVNRIGHAFLVDRYRRFRTKVTSYYEWELDDPNYSGPLPKIFPITEVSYSSPHITSYGMNWGQLDTTANASWCSLSGVWQYDNLPPYQYNRRMIYDFSIIQ